MKDLIQEDLSPVSDHLHQLTSVLSSKPLPTHVLQSLCGPTAQAICILPLMAFVQLNRILTTEALLGLENYHTKEALSSPLIKYRDSQQNFSSWKYN